MEATKDILELVLEERQRQDKKWGEQNHSNGTGYQCLYLPQLDARDIRSQNDQKVEKGYGVDWADILAEEVAEVMQEDDTTKLEEELVQVAAVAVAWVESIRRKKRMF